MIKVALAASLAAASSIAFAQSQEPSANVGVTTMPSASISTSGRMVPANTLLVVTPLQEISSKHVKVGDEVAFTTTQDVVEGGVVAIPRGTPVKGAISFKTGRAVGGKSGKFEVAFKTLSLGGRDYALRGQVRQEGRGNSVGALLGSMVISGRSAVMTPGQLVNIFTAEPVAY